MKVRRYLRTVPYFVQYLRTFVDYVPETYEEHHILPIYHRVVDRNGVSVKSYLRTFVPS